MRGVEGGVGRCHKVFSAVEEDLDGSLSPDVFKTLFTVTLDPVSDTLFMCVYV